MGYATHQRVTPAAQAPQFSGKNGSGGRGSYRMVKSVRNHPYLWENSGVKYDLVDIIDV